MSKRLGRLKALYRPAIAWILRRAAGLMQRLPRRLALAIGEEIGRAASRLSRKAMHVAVENLRGALGGERSAAELYQISRACFRVFGRTLAETMRLPAMSDGEILGLVRCEGFEAIERVRARGNGVLILSAHIGAWEVLAAWLRIRLGRPFHAIGRRLAYGPYNEILAETRRRAGVETIYQDESPRRALGVLRDNKPLGILADQDIKHLDGVFVEFFGHRAWTPTAPVALARASGAGIVPVVIAWKGRRHSVNVLPEVKAAQTGDRTADALENTQRWSQAIERIIRRFPTQWAWFHPRWRTRPPAG